MKQLLLLAFATLIWSTPALAQWEFAGVFPPDTLMVDGNGLHGVAVDPEGKVWLQPFGVTPGVTVEVPELDNAPQTVRQIFVYNADGTPADFSPITFIDFADGVTPRDTLGGYVRRNAAGDQIWEGRSGRGLRADSDGNIIVSQFATLYKLDYQTGQGLAKAEVGFTLGQADSDAEGNIYVGPVSPGSPVRIYSPDLEFLGNAIDATSNFSRGVTVSPDGLTLFETNFENTYTTIHQRENAFADFDSVGVAFRGMRVESAAFHPTTGNLWVSSGNPLNKPNQDEEAERHWLSNTWYEFSPNNFTTPLDSIQWASCTSFEEDGTCVIEGVANDSRARPRGIAFTQGGDVAYVVGFSATATSPGSNAQKFIFAGGTSNEPGAPETIALSQNYPNPFRDATRIEFTVERAGHVSLRVYDVLGREVAVLVDELLAPSAYTASLSADGLASGTYVYVLEQDGRRLSSNRMQVVR